MDAPPTTFACGTVVKMILVDADGVVLTGPTPSDTFARGTIVKILLVDADGNPI